MASHYNVLKFWHDRTLRAHFLVNVLVGIVIAIIFALTTTSQWGEGLLNTAFDLLVRYEHGVAKDPSPETNRLFFVEITPDEYQRLGEPLITPRYRVAELLETAWKSNASVVTLDILLDRPDTAAPDGDTALRNLLERMLQKNSRTQIIFPVRIGSDGIIRSHLYEDLFNRTTADGRHIFHRAVPTVLASEGDLQNRFWGLYQIGRDQHGGERVIWNLPLMASALLEGYGQRLNQLASTLLHDAHAVGQHTSHGHVLKLREGHIEVPSLILREDKLLTAGEAHGLPYTQRIRFMLSPDTRSRRDADKFRPDLAIPDLAGKVVVIGNGSPETGDILATPVGRMPGMYVIGNAINTIITGRMPVHMNTWLHYGIEALVIVFAAWLFLHFHSMLAQNLASLVFIILFVPLSWLLYKEWGIFFNFIIPVVGMRLHKVADSIETLIASRGRKQHHHQHH